MHSVLSSVMLSDFVSQLGQSNPTQHNTVYTISSLLISTKHTYCTLALNQVLVVECIWTPKLAVRGAVHKKKNVQTLQLEDKMNFIDKLPSLPFERDM
jgi:hypothetical protein